MKKNIENTVTETAIEAATVALEYRRNDRSLRVEVATLGVGLNASGSYVSAKVEAGALKSSIDYAQSTEKSFSKERLAFVLTGNKGTVVRFGRLSKCGQFAELVSQHGKTGIVSLAIFGEQGTVQVLTEAELAKSLEKATVTHYVRDEDKAQFTGKQIGRMTDDYASLVYALGGKLVAVDIETRHLTGINDKVFGALGGENKEMAKRTAGVLEKLTNGTVQKRGGAVKAKNKKEVKAEVEEALASS